MNPFTISFFQALLNSLVYLLIVIALDFAIGVVSAVRSKTFEWRKLGNLLSDYGVKVLVWIALSMLSALPKEIMDMIPEWRVVLGSAGSFAYMIILITAIGSILNSAKELGLLPVQLPGVGKNA